VQFVGIFHLGPCFRPHPRDGLRIEWQRLASMSFGVLIALTKARRTVGDTVTSTGRRGTGGGPWGRPENEGASVTRYGLVFPTFRDAFLQTSQKRDPLPIDVSC
jgi:hypothetical protein